MSVHQYAVMSVHQYAGMSVHQYAASSTHKHCARLHATLWKSTAQAISAVKAVPRLCLLSASQLFDVSLDT